MPEKFPDNLIEQKEKNVKVKTLSAEELIDRVYKNQSLPQDKRFLSMDKGGVFKHFDLNELNNFKSTKFYPIIENKREIIGLAELEENSEEQKKFWIKFLSIDSKYQGQGYASRLTEEIFRFAKERGFSLETSSYSEDGWMKLKHLFKRYSQEFKVYLIDHEKHID